jgi:hypothetical protein
LRKFEGSGLSAKEFCAREGISCPSLYQWKKRLGNSSSRAESSGPQFQPVQVVGDSMATVEFPGLATLRIPTARVEVVRAVVAELRVASREPGSC